MSEIHSVNTRQRIHAVVYLSQWGYCVENVFIYLLVGEVKLANYVRIRTHTSINDGAI